VKVADQPTRRERPSSLKLFACNGDCLNSARKVSGTRSSAETAARACPDKPRHPYVHTDMR
jgi:hypothetical protein